MGTKSLKVGMSVTIQDNGQKGVISEIDHGKYRIGKSKLFYSAGDLVADKVVPEKKKREKIAPASSKTMLLHSIYKIMRGDFLRQHTKCRARFAGCTEKSEEIHHMYRRTGFWLIVARLFCPICSSCHRYATDHSKEAVAAGISISRTKELPYNFSPQELRLMKNAGINPPE